MERVLNALKLVGEDELKPLIEEQGKIATRCEFCGKSYEVDTASFAELFRRNDALRLPGSRLLQ